MTQAASNSTKTPANATALPRRGDAIDQWLAMFARFLHLPADQSRGIRDELDSHMRERVRDLMLEGLSEDEGMRRAIDELGEAAELAAHFRAAHKPNRRLAMSVAAIGVAAGAAVVSIVALTQSQAPQPSAMPSVVGKQDPQATPFSYQVKRTTTVNPTYPNEAQVEFATTADPRATGKESGGAPMLSDLPIVGKMFIPAASSPNAANPFGQPQPKFDIELTQTTVRDIAELIGKKLNKRVMFHAGDVKPDVKIDKFVLVEADVPTAMRELNRALGLSGSDAVDFRVRTDVLEVGPVRDFDRLEQSLVAYDLRDVFACDANAEDFVSAVLQFVESDGWRDNGGDTARLKVVGTKMFVEAPPRYHERVAWILSQFSRKPGKVSAAPATLAPIGTEAPSTNEPRAGAGAAANAPVGVGASGMVPGGGAPAGGADAAAPSATGTTAAPRAVNSGAAPGGGSPYAVGGSRVAPGGAPVTNDPMSAPKPVGH